MPLVQPAAGPVLLVAVVQEDTEEGVWMAPPMIPRIPPSSEEFDMEVLPSGNVSELPIALMMSCLDTMERRFKEVFKAPVHSDNLQSLQSYH